LITTLEYLIHFLIESSSRRWNGWNKTCPKSPQSFRGKQLYMSPLYGIINCKSSVTIKILIILYFSYDCITWEEIVIIEIIISFLYLNTLYVPEYQSCQDDCTHSAQRIQSLQTMCILFHWRNYGLLCLSLMKR